ncbi:MAG: hypothetical protein HKN68_18925, partial [Saprospiraceae bacterium]|nr:hypothetical protein [Saprospiraceae bacterium]
MKVLKITIVLIMWMCYPIMIYGQHLDIGNIKSSLNQMMPQMIKEHQSLVSIPNDSNYPEDMDKNVSWIKEAYEKRGYKVSVLETETIPVIFCEYKVSEDLPTILFYIHYDGQPVDPSEWDQEDPFVPVIRNESGALVSYDNISQWNDDWRIYARAAADDKAPIMMMLYASDLMKQHN